MSFGKVDAGSFRIQPGVPANRDPGEFEPIQRTFENIQSHLQGGEFMKWKGEWVAGGPTGQCYKKGDVVYQDGWLMIANKDTCDVAAPQPTGPEIWIYDPIASPDETDSVTAKQIVYGQRYTNVNPVYLTEYRLYTIIGNEYEVVVVKDPLGDNEATWVNEFVADTTEWRTFGLIPVIISAGTTFDLIVISKEPDPTPIVISANYDYKTPPNFSVPPDGVAMHPNSRLDVIAFAKIDNDATDRTALLLALDPGDVIRVGTSSYAVQAITNQTGYVDVIVAPAAQLAGDGVRSFDFETVTATPITHWRDIDEWLGSSIVRGLFVQDDSFENVTENDDQWGADIRVQEADISEDWDLLSTNSGTPGGSSGGGGGAGVNTVEFGAAIALADDDLLTGIGDAVAIEQPVIQAGSVTVVGDAFVCNPGYVYGLQANVSVEFQLPNQSSEIQWWNATASVWIGLPYTFRESRKQGGYVLQFVSPLLTLQTSYELRLKSGATPTGVWVNYRVDRDPSPTNVGPWPV